MGFWKNVFTGGDPEYRNIDMNSPAGQHIRRNEEKLLSISERSRDRIEIVVSDAGLYVLLGRPPKQFDMIVIDTSGNAYDLRNYLVEKFDDQAQTSKIFEELGRIYEGYQGEPRFRYILGMRSVIATPSDPMAASIAAILTSA